MAAGQRHGVLLLEQLNEVCGALERPSELVVYGHRRGPYQQKVKANIKPSTAISGGPKRRARFTSRTGSTSVPAHTKTRLVPIPLCALRPSCLIGGAARTLRRNEKRANGRRCR